MRTHIHSLISLSPKVLMSSAGFGSLWPTPLDRYLVRNYIVDVGEKEGRDQYCHRHSNGIVMGGVAHTHLALREGRKIK